MLLILMSMSHRLQVILDTKEYSLVKKEATSSGESISTWVRGLIRKALSRKKTFSGDDPIEFMRRMSLPAPPIEQMLEEIERGRW